MNSYSLFDEKIFYKQFIKDLRQCQYEVYIESPFITSARMRKMYPIFEELIGKGVKVYVTTRDPKEHIGTMPEQAEYEIQRFERLGVKVFIALNSPHRKIAILDRKITWEGSLNILSQAYSKEYMRRTISEEYTMELFHFFTLERIIGSSYE